MNFHRMFQPEGEKKKSETGNIIENESPYSETQETASYFVRKTLNTISHFPAINYGN